MSLVDRLASQDTLQLLSTATSISLIGALSQSGTSTYNFPLFLFGIIAHELKSSNTAFRQFLILLPITGFLDLFTLLVRSQSSIITWLAIVLVTLLKVPLWFSGGAALRERGGELGGFRGVGLPGGGANSAGQGNWNLPMPGSFAGTMPRVFSDNGNGSGTTQPASNNNGAGQAQTQPSGQFPTSGGFRLGGEDEEGQGHAAGQPGRNGYQTIG
ncbi:hypothetical protein B9479_002823 [Cryptococcus floricola]|uniref:Uncharacterized protein n=1 Tax=Cryptococcus floricola TaxID=2591691 RepID=A0A5D3B2C3_9TREE|nr:hypothetical protein B9479_002823 [Cryptococcus floricola]